MKPVIGITVNKGMSESGYAFERINEQNLKAIMEAVVHQ